MAKEYVISLRRQIDQLLQQREATVCKETDSFTSSNAKSLQAEGVVLKDIRDILISEFERFHIGVNKFNAFEKSLYVLNASSMGVLSAAEIIPLVAAHRRNPRLDGPAAVLAMITGGMIVATPIVGRVVGKFAAARDRHNLDESMKEVVTTNMEKLDTHRKQLAQLSQSCQSTASSRLAIYESQMKGFRERLDRANEELRSGRRVASQNILAGALVGGTVVGSEAVIACAGFHYPYNARRFNVLVDSGSIGIVGALSFAMLDNLRIHAQTEVNRSKLKRQGQLPEQALKSRLSELTTLEGTLK